jgi:Putative peptidoglycan binding domain
MNSISTKKFVAGFAGFAIALSLVLGAAAPAQAATVAELQAMIATLQAQLSGASTAPAATASYTFARNLTVGSTGSDVKNLQVLLNWNAATRVAVSGAGSPGKETSTFGPATKAAVIKYQRANNIPTTGYVGPLTRAALALVSGGSTPVVTVPGQTTPVVVPTGSGLRVSLAADSANTALVAGQAIGELGKFTFVNPTASPITITNLAFKRTGASSDSTLSNIYLYQGANRLTDAAGISNTAFNFNSSAGLVTVPAGSSVSISVRADIATGTSGQLVGAQLVSVGSNGLVDSGVVFPISSYSQTISSATIGTISFTNSFPNGSSENPAVGIRVFEGAATVSTHAAWLQSIAFENRGSSDDNDITNLKLYVDGIQVGNTVAQLTNARATFDLSANPLRLETGTRTIKVMADVIGGSGETLNMQIRRAADVRFVDAELGQPILVTGTLSGTANTISAATLSVVRANTSPSTNISVGATNVKLATFEFRAAGEDVKVETITASSTATGLAGLDNGKIFLNGVQVGSTLDIANGASTEFNFGSSFILKQGQVATVDIYADAKNTSATNIADGGSITVGLSIAAADTEGVDSGDSVSAISNVAGFTRTVSQAAVSLSKYSGYGNQTIIAGTNNAKLGAFTLSAGSTEGVNVNTLTVTLVAAEAASITDLVLKDSVSGAELATAKASPSTTNSYSVNIAVPVSGTRTVNVYANVKSGANAGPWHADVAGSGTGMVTSETVTISSATLQTITFGSGSLTSSVSAGNPVSTNVIAGATSVKVGEFTFNAANTAFTVNELKIKVPTDAATSVSQVTLKYKDADNVTQSVGQALVSSATAGITHATATFQGLSFYIPQDDNRNIEVFVDLPTTSSGAKSGAAISVVIDANEGFKAKDSSGTDTTSISADLNSAATSGYGTKYVKKSYPTLAKITSGLTNSVSSGGSLYKFTVSADATASIDWNKISFTVATTTVTAADFTLYDITSGTAVALNATAANTNGSNVLAITADAIQQVSPNETKTYELRAATVTGWGASGDSIAVSLTADTSAVVNAAVSSLSSSNMIWSDRSSTSHTSSGTSATDWTNGYLIKNTIDSTRECQFGTATTCN